MGGISKHLTLATISKGHEFLNDDRVRKGQSPITFKEYQAKYGPKGKWGSTPAVSAPEPVGVVVMAEPEVELNGPMEVALIQVIQRAQAQAAEAQATLDAIRNAREVAPEPVAQVIPIERAKSAPKPKVSKSDEPRTWAAYLLRGVAEVKVGVRFTYYSKKYDTTTTNEILKVNKDGSVVAKRVAKSKGRAVVAA